MKSLTYEKLNKICPADLIPLLNNHKIREHLIEHELFDESSAKDWIKSKIKVNSSQGCKVRAILIDKQLAGWCGIQLEDKKYEIAIVIDETYWGLGRTIFMDIMSWAKQLGHRTIYIHLLHTRPEYKFLRKISINVYISDLLGSKFTTYELAVD